MNSLTSMALPKPHYEILDGLRGVAAIIVVLFHILEVHSGGDHTRQIINHGYLAVDFFFLLSGFVISYAYDDRWNSMSLKDFFKRRLIRLHPMIIVGSVVGAIAFYFQDAPALGWGEIHNVPLEKLLLVMLIGCTLIPVGKGLDIRGWNEMHPLNGPAWSLFFEYIANIAYAFVLRRISNATLTVLIVAAAAVTVHFSLTNPNGDMVGGWSIDDPQQLKIGFIRLCYPFLAGMLLARVCTIRHIKFAFPISAILLMAILAAPRFGGKEQLWLNGAYESFAILILFPLIIWLGAGGKIEGTRASGLCRFLGDISYPIYITHFPLIYIYSAWVVNNNYSLKEALPAGLLTLVASIVLAFITMRIADVPVRAWLTKRYLLRIRDGK